jgi:transcriptional regulator GlxA family with amidase domain
MEIAVLTFDAFNELDSFVVAALLNRLSPQGWKAYITAPTPRVTSRNGVVVEAQKPLEFAAAADAVVFGSGMKTEEIAQDEATLRRIAVDPARQLVASQCSGALMLERLGLLAGAPACTDLFTRPFLAQRGVEILDRPFHASGNVATAGGCLASQYIATWIIGRRVGIAAAERIIYDAAPVGQKQDYVDRAIEAVKPFLFAGATMQAVA